jgi:hypothetical protein
VHLDVGHLPTTETTVPWPRYDVVTLLAYPSENYNISQTRETAMERTACES